MLDAPKIMIDGASEFRNILKPWTIGEFWDLDDHDYVDDAIYLFERQRMVKSGPRIKQEIARGKSRFVFNIPFEGSETLRVHIHHYGLSELVRDGKLLLIGGGDMDPSWPCLRYDLFLTKFHNFEENLQALERSNEIFTKLDKPYKFLFLNGRERPHRKYLVEQLDHVGLLDQAIWSYLSPLPAKNRYTNLVIDGVDLMTRARSVKLLDPYYEVPQYRDSVISDFNKNVKTELFKDNWGDIYVNAESYIDTYFSLVTETVFDYPYSFRTEKIVKPIAMGHPFVVVANKGYYKDLHNLGFQTFGHLIDESFDDVDDNQKRLERISLVVQDLCRQDLKGFLTAAQDICKYNQQQLLEVRAKVQKDFPERFFQFLRRYDRS